MSTDRHLVLQVHMEIDLHSLQSQNVLHVEQVYIVIKKDRLMMTILLFVLQDSIVSKDHHISIHSQTQVTMVLAQLDITVRKELHHQPRTLAQLVHTSHKKELLQLISVLIAHQVIFVLHRVLVLQSRSVMPVLIAQMERINRLALQLVNIVHWQHTIHNGVHMVCTRILLLKVIARPVLLVTTV